MGTTRPGGDPGSAPASGTITGIRLDGGTLATGYVFTDPAGSVTGSGYEDLDGDGLRQLSEPGIEGVTVVLGGATTATTTTGPGGAYVFRDLPAGTYTLTETQPDGYLDGREAQGSPAGTRSGGDALTGIVLGTLVDGTGYTFGEVRAGSLSGAVRTDTGLPVRDVVVTLTGTVDGVALPARSARTDATGAYSFPGLRPGSYTLTETQPDAYGAGTQPPARLGGSRSGTDAVVGIPLASGQAAVGYDFVDDTARLVGHGRRGPGRERRTGRRDGARPRRRHRHAVRRCRGDHDRTRTPRSGGRLVGLHGLARGRLRPHRGPARSATSTAASPSAPRLRPPAARTRSAPAARRRRRHRLRVRRDPCGVAERRRPPHHRHGPARRPGASSPDPVGSRLTTTSGADGAWTFPALSPGTYTVTETQPAAYGTGTATPGTALGTTGGATGDDAVSGIVLASGQAGTGYVFTDEPGSLARLRSTSTRTATGCAGPGE